MELKNPLPAVSDMERSLAFYEEALSLRVVRFYDPDRHIIEVGENMTAVCRRFLDSRMTPEQTAARMDVPVNYVRECIL